MFGTICKPDEQYNLLITCTCTSFYYFSSFLGRGGAYNVLFLSCHKCLSTQLLHFNKFGAYSLGFFFVQNGYSPQKSYESRGHLDELHCKCLCLLITCTKQRITVISILKEFLTWNISSECYGHYGRNNVHVHMYVFP